MSISQAVSNVWAWLETWLDDKGGVHGYVVHHHYDNLRILSPDTWTQAPCILGLLRIYQKTGRKKWLKLALKLCDYLVKIYIKPLHIYRNSNHERKPLGRPGIIHNAIASYSLLEVAKEIRGQGNWQTYLQTAKDNILNFLLQLWNGRTLLSVYHGRHVQIHNMNSIGILPLISLSELERDESYVKKYGRSLGRSILACQVKEGTHLGAYPYVNTAKDYRTIYSLITSIGLLELYRETGDSDFLASVEENIKHLANFVDDETRLICHYHKLGYPQWIPDTLLFVLNVKQLANYGVNVAANITGILGKVLSQQYVNGGFPLSIGFQDLSYRKGLPSKPEIRRWRDLLPTPNWSAWNFWVLAELLPKKFKMNKPDVKFPLIIDTDEEESEGPYQIMENEKEVTFKSVRTQKIVGFFNKVSEVADFCLIRERGDYWRTIDSLMKYPEPLRRLILVLPNILGRS